MQIRFLYGTLQNTSESNTTISLLSREILPSFLKNTDFYPPPTVKSTKHLGLSPKECTYLGVAYFLFKCQRSELILSCWRCMFALSTQYLFFPWRLAEV